MKISSKTFGKIALIAAVASFSSLASAQFYVGGSIGQSMNSFDNGAELGPQPDEFNITGPLNTSSDESKTKTAFKAIVGYSFNPYVAVEGGYAKFGKPSYRVNSTFDDAGVPATQSGIIEHDKSAWFLAAKGTLPINEQFGVFAKLGVSRNQTKFSGSNAWGGAAAGVVTDFSKSETVNKTALLYGVGAEYNLTKAVSLNLEYMNFGKFGNEDVMESKTSMWSVGAAYKF